jgi:BCD family chlorophyll transporter-like MFS transporter
MTPPPTEGSASMTVAPPAGSQVEPALGWGGIVRLGLVQTAIGALFALTSRTLNRVMVVEYAMPAILPAAFIAWNYVVQLSRPRWGYGSDAGGRRTPWIIGGMGVLALGALVAVDATTMMASSPVLGAILAFVAYSMVGAGVGAAGTSLLALLATRVAPGRRPAAAAATWIMMIFGFVLYAAFTRGFLEPFSPARLAMVASGVAGACFLGTLLALRGAEGPTNVPRASESAASPDSASPPARPSFRQVVAETWADPLARRFTVFVFVSMLAYSTQELILEPYAGLVFHVSPAGSAQLTGVEQGGALLGMILVGALGARFGDRGAAWMRRWTVAGCVGSAIALAGLSAAGLADAAWSLSPTVFLLGLANGVFAVAAIGSMMGLAGAGAGDRAGSRLGLWGGAQAGAFALGGFLGAVGVEALRGLLQQSAAAFVVVFAVEALVFLVSAILAAKLEAPAPGTVTAEGAFGATSAHGRRGASPVELGGAH